MNLLKNGVSSSERTPGERWYRACGEIAALIESEVPAPYRSRTFSGIIGDIKALSPKKASSLIGRKKGLGVRYAYLYLARGIDRGRGYQACAAEALRAVLGDRVRDYFGVRILDVGCAVGVTAGVFGTGGVTGFDLFPDLLHAAARVDVQTGMRNDYAAADMTRDWPFRQAFDTVVCGLVCHHLKDQTDILRFFTNASRVLIQDGSLVITLPSGSLTNASQLESIAAGVEEFGFRRVPELTGLVISTDSPRSLFWMFSLVFIKTGGNRVETFISPNFRFPDYRTPVSREEKGARVRAGLGTERSVRHTSFRLLTLDELKMFPGARFVFSEIAELANTE
jgi:SAM-dependent methyltransferase